MARHQLSFSNERLFGDVLFKGFGKASAQSSPLLKMPRRQMQTFSFRAAFCVRFTPAIRFYWDVLRSVHACHTLLLGCFAFGSRLPYVSCVLVALVRLSTLAGSLRVCSFICGDPDGGRGERGWRLSVSALLRNHIGFAMFSAGSTLGLRAPDCAKESKVEAALPPLWTLFTLRRDCLSAYSQRLCAFAQPHQPC